MTNTRDRRILDHQHLGPGDGGWLPEGAISGYGTTTIISSGDAGAVASIPSGTYLTATGGQQDVIQAHGAAGSTETIDPASGNVHTLTLDADCTITITPPAGTGAAALELWVTEDGTGGWAVIWPGSVTEEGTHDTTLGTTQRVILESVDGGTNWIATWIGASTGTALTVEDEGSPLTTAADTLDFVGPGVVASGSGSTKTITIEGGATASDAGIWRPLMDSGSGAVITDGGTGEAVMGFGPA